jgi:hypothetical protein
VDGHTNAKHVRQCQNRNGCRLGLKRLHAATIRFEDGMK